MKSFIKKRNIVYCILVILIITSCSKKNTNSTSMTSTPKCELPTYARKSSTFQLLDDANPYIYSCGEDGMFYFVMKKQETDELADSKEEWVPEYNIYYQTYDKGPTSLYGTIEGGIINDITSIKRNDKLYPVILQLIDEEAHLIEINENGKQTKNLTLDAGFCTYEQMEDVTAFEDGYVISKGNELFLLDKKGNITKILEIEYSVLELLGTDNANSIYALGYDKNAESYEQYLLLVDKETFSLRDAIRLDEEITKVYPFEDGLLSIYDNRIVFWHPGKDDAEAVIDLNRQDIMALDIKYIYGSAHVYKIVTLDGTFGCLMTLTEKEEAEVITDDRFTEDGRRIVRVAVPEDFLWNMQFHAKLYNKTSEVAFVEVIELQEDMEFYLGKGNRPDIICFDIANDFVPYIEKKALANMMPLFENQTTYSLDDILPKARELLTYDNGNAIYYMAPYFHLLLQVSDGTECDQNNRCNTTDYLFWRDQYMKDRDIYGYADNSEIRYGDVKYLIYANIDNFYDETSATANFTADEFKQLMRAYKETEPQRRGKLEKRTVVSEFGQLSWEILRGPVWYSYYGLRALSNPNTVIGGIPGIAGDKKVYLRLNSGLGILETSECKQEAFDFIMHFSCLDEHLVKGFAENMYRHGGETFGYLATSIERLNAEIFETEKEIGVYSVIENGEEKYYGLYFTDEMKDHLRYLIDIAELDTQTRRVIFDILLEEMNPYLNGSKDLDSACEILSSRVRLYLQERQ